MPTPPSLESVFEGEPIEEAQQAALIAKLRDREDEVADFIRATAMQFGLFAQIVAEALAESTLGTPLDEEARAMVHQQYVDLITHLNNQQ